MRILVGLATLTILGIAVWGYWDRSRVRADAETARQALDLGDLQTADAALSRWLSARPRSAEAHFQRARLTLATGDRRLLESELTEALALGYPPAEVQRLRGFGLVLAGRYADAEPLLSSLARTTTSPDPQLDEALARIYLQTYRIRDAEGVLERWAEHAPDDPRPHLWRTEIDRRADAPPDVLADRFREALARDPDLDAARLGLAECLRQLHQNVDAAEEFSTYLSRHPDDLAARIGAGANALEVGDLKTAVDHLDHALALEPKSAAALKERARLALRMNDTNAARCLLDRAIAGDPFDPESYHTRSLVRMRLGEPDEAERDQAVADRLRREHAELGDLRRRLNRDPNNNGLRLEIARWMFTHGQDASGLEWSRVVLASDPDHAPTHALLAEHFARIGDHGRANYHRMRLPRSAR